MDHVEAKQILANASAEIEVDEDGATATITGTVSIDELHAILQLLEYNA